MDKVGTHSVTRGKDSNAHSAGHITRKVTWMIKKKNLPLYVSGELWLDQRATIFGSSIQFYNTSTVNPELTLVLLPLLETALSEWRDEVFSCSCRCKYLAVAYGGRCNITDSVSVCEVSCLFIERKTYGRDCAFPGFIWYGWTPSGNLCVWEMKPMWKCQKL